MAQDTDFNFALLRGQFTEMYVCMCVLDEFRPEMPRTVLPKRSEAAQP